MFKYGFFNAVDGDRLYNADDISSFYTGLMSDGVCTVPPTSLWVLHRTGEGLTFAVLPGRAFVQSKYFINTKLDVQCRISRYWKRFNATLFAFISSYGTYGFHSKFSTWCQSRIL